MTARRGARCGTAFVAWWTRDTELMRPTPCFAVLADGTILSVCGKDHGNRAIAIRWRLVDE